MSFDIESLYALLPAFHRIRDTELGSTLLTPAIKATIVQLQAELAALPSSDSPDADMLRQQIDEQQRGPLKALLSIIAEQIAVLDENLNQLYDDQFIETCAEWVVPYIGDLVGNRQLLNISSDAFSQRAEVANTISYRRRKGTASVLQQLARDVTGWDATVVEYFQLLATTQYMNHLRPQNLSIADLRDREGLYYLDGPFGLTPHTADVRNIQKRRGKFNIPNIGIWLYRIGAYTLTQAPAYKVDDRRYRFDALGRDLPLYNLPQVEEPVLLPATPLNVPLPLGRWILFKHFSDYYGAGLSLLVYQNGVEVPADEVIVCDLGDRKDSSGDILGWAHAPKHKIAIDPERGRLVFPSLSTAPQEVQVTWQYGFPAEMGSGGYGRQDSFSTGLPELLRVPADKATIQEALDALAETGGIIEIQNNDYYFETPVIQQASGTTLELRAADKCRPILVAGGEIVIMGGANTTININGLLVSGGYLHVPALCSDGSVNQLSGLNLTHCCLLPAPTPAIGGTAAQPFLPRLVVEAAEVQVVLDRTITGGIRAVDSAAVSLKGTIVDAGDPTEVAYSGLTGEDYGAPLTISNGTLIGKVYTLISNASNTIFYAALLVGDSWPLPVIAERVQEGCTRFSYFPAGSKLPRPFRCQPELGGSDPIIAPVFTSLRYGDAGYCQLSNFCPCEIKKGADDGAEMGAYHDLFQPQRLSNLRTRLDEYLRFNLEAGIFFGS